MTRSIFSLSCVALFFMIALASPIIIRPYWEATRHYHSGLELLQREKYQDGMVELRKSLSWRSPYNSAAEQSSRELYNISQSNPDKKLAQIAAEELWRGLQSSRSWYMAIPGLWRGISENSSHHLLSEKFPPPSNQIREEHQPQVSFLWQSVAHASLISWVSLLFVTIRKNFSIDGNLLPSAYRAFFLRLSAVAVLWLIWMVALNRA